MKRTLQVIVLLILFPFGAAMAQVDSLFTVAREYAFNGKREQARALCDTILKTSPNYADVRILKGRTFSWDGKREEARIEFKKVIANDSTNTEAYEALSDVEFWDDKSNEALNVVNTGLRITPNTKPLMLKKAKYLIDLNRLNEAQSEVNAIRKIDSACTECDAIDETIKQLKATNHVSAGASFDYFEGLDRLFLYQYIQVGKKFPKNSVIFRVNFNQRFQTSGFQPEIDMYPSLGKFGYLYLNYGYSNTKLFPTHRVGFEWYKGLPFGMEASAGLRYMDFGGGSLVWIYTASLTKYIGNLALIGRTFITPDPDTKSTSASLIINLRQYFADADNYFGVTVGAGYSPDQRVFLSSQSLPNQTEIKSIYYMQAYRAGLVWYKSFTYRHIFNIDVDYRYQELKIGPSSEFYHTYSAGISYKYKF
ncbi:MAG: YaiO family outer membrane beta-barrel protein [Bacteroidia bacterium]|nr:YaiO family outer membrane beta-barrel protein [Bacteroidia bacterium]